MIPPKNDLSNATFFMIDDDGKRYELGEMKEITLPPAQNCDPPQLLTGMIEPVSLTITIHNITELRKLVRREIVRHAGMHINPKWFHLATRAKKRRVRKKWENVLWREVWKDAK